MLAVETKQLTKNYGTHVGIKDVSLQIPEVSISAFIGKNGAGKTTTIRLLLDLIRPSSGSAQIFALDCQRDSLQARSSVSYLPGELKLPPNERHRDLNAFDVNQRA